MNSQNISEVRHNFGKDGYVFLPGFLSEKDVEVINYKLREFINNKVPGMPLNHVFYEDRNNPETLKQLQDLHLYDPFFDGILYNSEFEKIAEILLGEKVIGKNLEYFNKPPKIGKPTPPHQDSYYFMLNPPQAITMWMALENVDEETGCVRYIKGSHLQGMRLHGKTETLGFSQGITDYDEKDFAKEIPFPAKPGDLLIHHAMTIHRADGNKSVSRTRRALGFIYFGESAKEDLEAKNAYQKVLTEERISKEK